MAAPGRSGQSSALHQQPGNDRERVAATTGASMNEPLPAFVQELSNHLREYLGVCQEALELAGRENQALTGSGEYQPFQFYQNRKALHSRLDQSLNLLRTWRQAWQRLD